MLIPDIIQPWSRVDTSTYLGKMDTYPRYVIIGGVHKGVGFNVQHQVAKDQVTEVTTFHIISYHIITEQKNALQIIRPDMHAIPCRKYPPYLPTRLPLSTSAKQRGRPNIMQEQTNAAKRNKV